MGRPQRDLADASESGPRVIANHEAQRPHLTAGCGLRSVISEPSSPHAKPVRQLSRRVRQPFLTRVRSENFIRLPRTRGDNPEFASNSRDEAPMRQSTLSESCHLGNIVSTDGILTRWAYSARMHAALKDGRRVTAYCQARSHSGVRSIFGRRQRGIEAWP